MPVIDVIKTGADALLEFVFPSNCLICDKYIEQSGELICPACWDKIDTFDHIFCGTCEHPLSNNLVCSNCSEQDTLPIFALGRYIEPLDEIIRNFKYRKFQKLGPILAEKLIGNYSKLFTKIKIDIIIPIPLHSYRLKKRGYNQSLILADTIGNRLDLPVFKDGLIKIKNNKYQKSLDPAHRDKNVENVYRIGERDLKNKRIMLVDDVITTGATLREAKKVLHKAGGKVIITAAIAGASSWKQYE